MRMKNLLWTALLLLAAAGCSDDRFADTQEAIVAEGWIEAGSCPVVLLTKTLEISEDKQDLDKLSNNLLRWAVVKVSDGVQAEVLTGRYDKRYTPPYIYTASDLRGVAGRQYLLEVDYGDIHMEATTTIPQAPVLDSVEIRETEKGRYALYACFADTAEGNACYQLFTKSGARQSQFFASYQGSLGGNALAPYNKVAVYPPHLATQKDYKAYYEAGDTVAVKLARVDSVSHNFWATYDKKLAFGSNMMLNYDRNLPSNISGGLGYWCGYNSSAKTVAIPKKE
jgi:hypothetical protein